jgi:hypothetical protein
LPSTNKLVYRNHLTCNVFGSNKVTTFPIIGILTDFQASSGAKYKDSPHYIRVDECPRGYFFTGIACNGIVINRQIEGIDHK